MLGPRNDALDTAREDLEHVFEPVEKWNPNKLDLGYDEAPDNALFAAMNAENVNEMKDKATNLAEYGKNPDSYYIKFIGRAGPAISSARHNSLQSR